MRDLNIAYGNSRTAKFWSNKTIKFDELCDRLRSPIYTSETAEEYPKLPKGQRDEIKDKGGFVAGHLRDNRRQANKVVCRSMLVYDLDSIETEFLQNIGSRISNKGCYYTTHSHIPEHPRARMIIPVSRDMTPDEFNAAARYYAQDNGFISMLDPCSFSPHQLMYWPTCPSNGEYLFDTMEGDWLDPDTIFAKHPNWHDCSLLPTTPKESKVADRKVQQQKDPLEKEGVVGAVCRAYTVQEIMDTYLSDIYAPTADGSGRYDYIPGEGSAGVVIYEDKFAYSHHATDPAGGKLSNAFDLIRIHKFADLDEKKSYAAAVEFLLEDERVGTQLLKEKQEKAKQEFEDWTQGLQRDKNGNLCNTLRNLTLILENDERLQDIVFNQQLDGMEIKGSVPWKHPAKYWRDADDAQLISYIDTNYGTFSERNYKIAVAKVTDDRSYHPIREFLRALPDWDGIKRAETVLIDYLGAEDNKYVRAVTRKSLCAAVKRVLDPGCKFDTMIVLNGPQGIGKSTLISLLGGEWFSDSLSLNDTKDKTAAEKLQGYWILEIGELAGLRKAEVETLRSFISRQNDIYRAAFGKRPTPHPRQCIFIGTTNAESGYLRDTTGNRRFWPVKTPGNGQKHSWELKEHDVKQIWAEALEFVKAGEKLYLMPEEDSLAKDEQRAAMESDEREGLVREYLDTLLPDNWDTMDLFERRSFLNGNELGEIGRKGTVRRTKVSSMEIWCECFGKERANIGRADSNAITAILIKLEWERLPNKIRIQLYGPQYVFVPKSVPEDVPKKA
ncbi:virulence-associated E family protein [[Clostridium] innocuum]|nr:virulence-associated E family protein [[Clostridium] innocuum]